MKVPARGFPRSTSAANVLMLKLWMEVDALTRDCVSNASDCWKSRKMYLKGRRKGHDTQF